MPDVTVGAAPEHLAVPAGPGPWPGMAVKLVRLDFRPESSADAWHQIIAFFGEYLQ